MAHRHRLLYAAVGPLLFFFFGGIPFAHAEALAPSLIISEVNWAGSSRSQADEWIEFMNVGMDPLPLNGFTLQGALTGGATYSFPSVTLAPSATFLLANYAANGSSTVLTRSVDVVSTAVSLSNSALGLSLYAADGTLIDSAGTGKTPPAGSVDVAMVRVFPIGLGTEAASWKTAGDPVVVTPSGVAGANPTGEPEPVVEIPPSVEPEPIVIPDVEPIIETPDVIPDPIIVAPVDEPEPDFVITLAVEIPIETAPAAAPVGTLVINELVSIPNTGEDEWVEIYNPFNNVIPLNGWTLHEGSGKSTSLPDQLLGFGQFVIIKNPSGNLNNDGDSVILADAAGHAVDAIGYGGGSGIPAPAKFQSLARMDDGAWHITITPTPGAGNVITKPALARAVIPIATTAVFEPTTDLPESPSLTDTVKPKSPASDFDLTASFVLSELYPNTTNGDLTEEYIEIKNTGDRAADLRGWIVGDRSGTTYAYAQKTVLGPGEALALPRSLTRIALNNDGDTVTLSRPDKTAAAEMAYDKAARGQSYGLFDDGWKWTNHPTPDEANVPASIVVATVPVKSSKAGSGSAGKAAAPPKKVSVIPPPAPIHVLGIITSRSGRVVKAEKDGAAFSLTLPIGTDYAALGIKSGRVIEASGTVTTKSGKTSLTIKSVDDMHLSDVPPLVPIQREPPPSDVPDWFSQLMSSASVNLRRLFGSA